VQGFQILKIIVITGDKILGKQKLKKQKNYNHRFEAALKSSDPLESLASFAVELSSNNYNQDEIFQIFDSFRAELRIAGRNSDEDIVMEVMDRICGWCSPHKKLFSSDDQ